MGVITRSQKKLALYSNVLENPLILQNIFQHLDAKDTLNLSITNAPFTKEERFIDTLNVFLEEKQCQYDTRIDELFRQFCTHTDYLLDEFHEIKISGGSIRELVIQMRCYYDYINDNKLCCLEMDKDFKNMNEVMLLKQLNHKHFHNDTLFYLGEIFGIYVLTDDEHNIDYIVTSKDEKIYLEDVYF